MARKLLTDEELAKRPDPEEKKSPGRFAAAAATGISKAQRPVAPDEALEFRGIDFGVAGERDMIAMYEKILGRTIAAGSPEEAFARTATGAAYLAAQSLNAGLVSKADRDYLLNGRLDERIGADGRLIYPKRPRFDPPDDRMSVGYAYDRDELITANYDLPWNPFDAPNLADIKVTIDPASPGGVKKTIEPQPYRPSEKPPVQYPGNWCVVRWNNDGTMAGLLSCRGNGSLCTFFGGDTAYDVAEYPMRTAAENDAAQSSAYRKLAIATPISFLHFSVYEFGPAGSGTLAPMYDGGTLLGARTAMMRWEDTVGRYNVGVEKAYEARINCRLHESAPPEFRPISW